MGHSRISNKKHPRINIYNSEYYQRIVPSHKEYSRKNYDWEDELEEWEDYAEEMEEETQST